MGIFDTAIVCVGQGVPGMGLCQQLMEQLLRMEPDTAQGSGNSRNSVVLLVCFPRPSIFSPSDNGTPLSPSPHHHLQAPEMLPKSEFEV